MSNIINVMKLLIVSVNSPLYCLSEKLFIPLNVVMSNFERS